MKEIDLPFAGQITITQKIGSLIKELTERKEVKNIVDIGTFNGLGSTLCIIHGMDDSKELWSIELYPDMYQQSIENLSSVLNPNIHILNGRIIEYDEVFWFDHSIINFNIDEHARLWYKKDLEHLNNSKNVIEELPQIIDLLVLDGGEYTTYPEYKKLKDRSNIIVLDDTIIHKCTKVRNELINDSNFKVLYDDQIQRNGCAIFERIEWITS